MDNHRHKSYCFILCICLNIGISSFYIGYSLVYVSAMPDFKTIMNIYNVHVGSQQDTESFIQGIVPVGGILGGFAGKFVLSKFSRKNGLVLGNVFLILSFLLVFIKTASTFILGRIIQGVVLGIQTCLVPLYINEIVPPEYRNLGTIHVLLIGIGEGFTYFLYWFFKKFTEDQTQLWNIVSQYVGLLIILQTVILMFWFPFQTPKYLIVKEKDEELQSLVRKLYKQQFVDEILSQLEQHGELKIKQQERQSSDSSIKGSLITEQQKSTIIYNTSKSAIFFGIHLNLSKQLIGLNAIAVYGKQTLIQIFPLISDVLPIIVCVLPSVSSFIGSFLLKKYGRKSIIQFGSTTISITLFIMFLSFMIQQSHERAAQIMISTGMLSFMFIYGMTYGTVVFLYNPQIVQPKYLSWIVVANLSGAAFCIVLFPIIEGVLPDNNPAYLFLFFFVWTFSSIFVNHRYMVQTKDRSRQSIFEQYNRLKICK